MAKKGPKPARPSTVYRFKITLCDIQPPIWRMIEVADGALDQLHQHIQTAMGWTNSHLHEFVVGRRRYGDPQLLDDGFGDRDFENSRTTRIGHVLAGQRNGFSFRYLYDFGDGWEHEIALEGEVEAEPKAKYPRCIAGARACPPEDCGGPWGYADLLEILADPEHEEYENMTEWAGELDPEAFSVDETTASMQEGVFDWRAGDPE